MVLLITYRLKDGEVRWPLALISDALKAGFFRRRRRRTCQSRETFGFKREIFFYSNVLAIDNGAAMGKASKFLAVDNGAAKDYAAAPYASTAVAMCGIGSTTVRPLFLHGRTSRLFRCRRR